jgi:hypothetical protein
VKRIEPPQAQLTQDMAGCGANNIIIAVLKYVAGAKKLANGRIEMALGVSSVASPSYQYARV